MTTSAAASFGNVVFTKILAVFASANPLTTPPRGSTLTCTEAEEQTAGVDAVGSRPGDARPLRELRSTLEALVYRTFPKHVLSLSVAATLSISVMAQDTTARLSGMVRDALGAAVPNATITLTNTATRAQQPPISTNDSGEYTVLQVPPGSYTLTVEAQGFRKSTTTLQLSVASKVDVPVTLQPGDVSETVVVTAQAEQLNRSDATVSTLITPQDVDNLPLPNREITNLIALAPGVVHGGSSTSVNTSQLSINGSRTLNNETLLDGNSVVEGVTGQVSRLPSPDMLGEFRVITSNAPAEYGRTSGGVITLITRTGNNTFHGGVYELFRNAVLNANTLANKLQTPVVGRAKNNYNQFGAVFSGPIWLPHVYNGRDRTFFYLNYDQTLQRVASTQTQTVPSAEFRAGNFQSSPVLVYDPVTNTPFAGNQIPRNRIDAAAAKIVALYPLPNTTGTFDAVSNRYSNNFYYQTSLPYTAPRYSGRIDHAVGDKLRLYASVNRWNMFASQAVGFNVPAIATGISTDSHQGWQVSTGGTATLNPSTVVDVRFGWNRWVELRVPIALGIDPVATYGIARNPYNEPPSVNISSYSSVGPSNGSYSRTYSNTYTPYGSITKVLGSHTIKAGALLRKNQVNVFNPGTPFNGTYSFTGAITDISGSGGKATNALADFLLGAVKTSQYDLPQPLLGRRNYNVGVYVQDDYKITPKLTANLGVRYEYESPMYIATDRYSRFDIATGQLLVAGKNASRSLNINGAKFDFAPRIGLAYAPVEGTVVRAGFGTFYGQILSNLGGQISFPGYDVPVSYLNLGTRVAHPFTLSQGMPLTGVQDFDHPERAVASATPSSPFNIGSVSYQKISPMSLNQQWSSGVQQQFGKGTVVDISYVGSHALHLPLFLNGNLPAFNQATAVAFANTTLATQNARPFPTLGTLTGEYNEGNSNYNSLQLTGRRRFGTSFSMLSSYTWSHTIDDGSGIYNFSQANGIVSGQYPIDPALRRTDRSSSSFDVRHNYTLAIQYKTPGPKWTRNIEIAPIFSARTGFPLTVTQSNLFPGVSTQRPNGDTSLLRVTPVRNGNGIQLFKPATAADFPISPSGPVFIGSGATRRQVVATALGNVPRYSVRAPGEIDLDLSVQRAFPIYDRFKFIFRVDAFNVLNHNSLNPPSTSLAVTTDSSRAFFNSPGFGVTGGSLSNRFLQVVTRLNF